MSLVDIGANLTHKSFKRDLDLVLERARTAGVERIIVTGTSLDGSERALELARQHPTSLRSTAGIHPHDARHASAAALRSLEVLAREPEVVAVGECGLDYDRDFSPRDAQRRAFEAQLELAAAVGKSLFLHERAAHDDFIAILGRHRSSLGRVVVHCFTGTDSELSAYLEMGLDIGITGFITDARRYPQLPELVRRVPLDRLMIETDAPFIVPRALDKRTRRNEPAFLPWVLEGVARSRAQSNEELARSTTDVARAVFGL